MPGLFCSSPMIHIWDSHENKHKDIMKTWKRHVQCRPYTESQIRAQPSPVRPAQPNPRPTQHSAPTSVSSLFFSKIEPPQVNLFGEKKERWETNINKYLSVYRFNITKGSSSIIFWFLTSARRCVAVGQLYRLDKVGTAQMFRPGSGCWGSPLAKY